MKHALAIQLHDRKAKRLRFNHEQAFYQQVSTSKKRAAATVKKADRLTISILDRWYKLDAKEEWQCFALVCAHEAKMPRTPYSGHLK